MGYTNARRYKSGVLVQWNPEHVSMGVHTSYSSQSIHKVCTDYSTDPISILDFAMSNGKISRLDVCYDIFDVDTDIMLLYKQALEGVIKTRAKSFAYVESAESGNEKGAATAYIGSMSKRKKLLRVYDKGRQLNLDRYMTRFELETHGKIADNAAKKVIDDYGGADCIVGMIKGYADFGSTELGEYFSDISGIKLSVPQYKKGDTAQWLLDVVAKTLAREVDRDYDLLGDFISRFTSEYELINSKWITNDDDS